MTITFWLFCMHLIFEEVFSYSSIYIYIYLYRLTLFFKIKIIYFQIIFLICVTLHIFILFYSINLKCVSFSIIVWLNKKIILINKFHEYNRESILSCKIKYLDLYLSLDFSCFIFTYCLWSFHLGINTHSSQYILLHVCINFFIFT
jgi:hypothetical protein